MRRCDAVTPCYGRDDSALPNTERVLSCGTLHTRRVLRSIDFSLLLLFNVRIVYKYVDLCAANSSNFQLMFAPLSYWRLPGCRSKVPFFKVKVPGQKRGIPIPQAEIPSLAKVVTPPGSCSRYRTAPTPIGRRTTKGAMLEYIVLKRQCRENPVNKEVIITHRTSPLSNLRILPRPKPAGTERHRTAEIRYQKENQGIEETKTPR